MTKFGSQGEKSSPDDLGTTYYDNDDDDVTAVHRPSDVPEVESSKVDSLIAEQMSKLSMNEREQAYFDIHGISDLVEETPEMIEKSMEKLDQELLNLKDKMAYEKARSEDPQYVQNNDFRLKFLRADRFDAKKAALRMARHFDAKLDLFGPTKLVKDISQNDLEESDIDCLISGIGLHLPVRDSVGRLVRLTLADPRDHEMQSLGKFRAVFYSLMVMSDDVETQKKGIVLISWAVGFRDEVAAKSTMGQSNYKSGVWGLVKLAMTSLPIRHEAIHLCYDSAYLSPVFSLVKIALGMYLRVRVRSHYGCKADCLRKLQTFGIPTTVIPLRPPECESIREIWKKRKKYENDEEARSRKCVFVPGHLDILLGRGRRCQEHVGNMRLRNLVEDCKPVYDNASRKEKTLISQEIVENVQKNANYFLKDEDTGWVEVEDNVARLKVSHTFRDVAKDHVKKSVDPIIADHSNSSPTLKKREREN